MQKVVQVMQRRVCVCKRLISQVFLYFVSKGAKRQQ